MSYGVFQIRYLDCLNCAITRRVRCQIIDGAERIPNCWECNSEYVSGIPTLNGVLPQYNFGYEPSRQVFWGDSQRFETGTPDRLDPMVVAMFHLYKRKS